MHLVAALGGTEMREAGSGQDEVGGIGMINRREQAAFRFSRVQINRSPQSRLRGYGERNPLLQRNLRKCIAARCTLNYLRRAMRITRRHPPNACLIAQLNQS
jgi:hypothetical protein